MKPLLYFPLTILLFSCTEDAVKDFTLLKKKKHSNTTIEAVTSAKEDTIITAENISPDGSWEVLVNDQDNFFIGYTINYKDSSNSISKKINSEIDITSSMSHSHSKWINATTYQLPNIGETANGYYELLIYKDGSCKYIEHTDNLEETTTEETEISTVETNDKKEPQIDNSFSQNENFIVFRQDIKSTEENSSSESSLSMVIQNVVDSFEFKNEELSDVKLNYSFASGLIDFTGEKPFKGFIKGQLLENNTWKIEIDVWITTFSYAENEKGKKEIKATGIFNP